MSRLIGLGVLLAAAGLASADDKKDAPKDITTIQGTWKLTKAELNGKAVKVEGQVTFTETEITSVIGKMEQTGSFTLDPKKMPSEIDITYENSDGKTLGIYKFEKDGSRLLICFIHYNGGKRPKAFSTANMQYGVMWTLEKVKK